MPLGKTSGQSRMVGSISRTIVRRSSSNSSKVPRRAGSPSFVCRMGRQQEEMCAAAAARFSPENELIWGLTAAEMGRCDETQVLWDCDCGGGHVSFQSVHAVSRSIKAKRGLPRCGFCTGWSSGRREPSEWERQLQLLLDSMNLASAAEASAVNEWKAAVDQWLYGRDLLIQVDGEQHGGKPMYRTSGEQQLGTDDRFNQLVWRQGMRLLRLHWQDMQQAEACITKALNLIEQHPHCRFVLFSPSFRQADWVDLRTSAHDTPPYAPTDKPQRLQVAAARAHFEVLAHA